MLTFKIASELVTLHTETLILSAMILKIASLQGIAALADHCCLAALRSP